MKSPHKNLTYCHLLKSGLLNYPARQPSRTRGRLAWHMDFVFGSQNYRPVAELSLPPTYPCYVVKVLKEGLKNKDEMSWLLIIYNCVDKQVKLRCPDECSLE